MPLVETGSYTYPILVHEAPVNEKTKQLREKFKMDESGYPEHYKWRGMAQLGPRYNYDDPHHKFQKFVENEEYSTKVTIVGLITAGAFGTHWLMRKLAGKSWYSKIYQPVVMSAGLSYFMLWIHNRSLERQNIKNHMIMDYANKHPERFGPIDRPKVREVLMMYQPSR